MSNLTATVYPGRPKTICRDTDKPAILARSNGSWNGAAPYNVWDSKIISEANNFSGFTLGEVAANAGVADGAVDEKFLVLALAGWIDNVASYHTKLRDEAIYLAENTSGQAIAEWPGRRSQILALAWAYDFLKTGVISFSDSARKSIGDQIVNIISNYDAPYEAEKEEFIDGVAAGNLMGVLHGALAIYGESGTGFNYTSAAQAAIDKVMKFWVGDVAGARSRIDTDRYFAGGGGSGKGAHYNSVANYHSMLFLHAVHNGFVRNADSPGSLLLLGEEYAPWTDEMWVQKVGEWWLNVYLRGDIDYWALGDNSKKVSPWFDSDSRKVLGTLIRRGGAWRKQVRWLYDLIHKHMTDPTTSGGLGQSASKYSRAMDVIFWDPSDSANASQSPTAAGTTKTRLFDPPGHFVHRNTWDVKQSCIVQMSAGEFGYQGHPHLDVGAIQISVKDDMVLLHAGRFDNDDAEAGFGGDHHRTYYQQSGAHSGCILIQDPAKTTPHKVNLNGTRTSVPDFLGGQWWREWDSDGNGTSDVFDVTDVNSMRFNSQVVAGKVRDVWRRSGEDQTGLNKFRIVSQVANQYAFVHADIRRSYLLRPDHFDTSNDRTRRVELKRLVIMDVWQWPIILIVDWAIARQLSFPKQQSWHTNRQPTAQTLSATIRRYSANGQKNVGRIHIDSYSPGKSFSVVGGGTLDGNGYAANQYVYLAGQTNRKPALAWNTREDQDLGRYRLDVLPTVGAEEDYFVTLLFPCLAGETPPAYTWINEARWFGVDFSGKQYRIDKTNPIAEVSSAGGEPPPDTTAPATPTGLTAVAGDAQVTLDWNNNSEGDLAGYRVYRSTKVSGVFGADSRIASPTSSSYVDTSAQNGTTYRYRVSAIDNAPTPNESVPTAYTADVTPAGAPPPPPPSAPAAPTGLVASAGQNQVALDWNDNTESNLASYSVYREKKAGEAFEAETTIATGVLASAYTDVTAVNGTTYRYRVGAVSTVPLESPRSAYSAEVTPTATAPPPDTTPPNPPIILPAVSGPGDGQITANWSPNAESDIKEYQVKYREVPV